MHFPFTEMSIFRKCNFVFKNDAMFYFFFYKKNYSESIKNIYFLSMTVLIMEQWI